MRITVKRLIRDEKGQVMVLALILLVVGGLIIAPLLGFMSTGLIAGEVYERKMDELYAADAGVEDALWNIQRETDKVQELTQCNQSTNYTITDVNGKKVGINITLMTIWDGLPCDYRVVSTATGDGSGTEIDAYIIGESKYGDYSGILNNVLTSQDEIIIQPGVNITPEDGEHSAVANYTGAWPPLEELEAFYLEDVEGETPYTDSILDVNDYAGIGPLSRNGTLDIINTGTAGLTLQLTGTIYITGDTLISPTKDLILDLNGHTLFVASNSSDPEKALYIGGKCTIEGPGVIIAIGDIYFEPKGDVGSPEEPVFVFSVLGETLLQPGGDFYGSIAGSVEVQLQPGTSLSYPEDEGWYDGLNFLVGVQELIYSIYSWDISQQ